MTGLPARKVSNLARSSGVRTADSRLRLRQAVDRSKRRNGVNLPIGFVRSEQKPPLAQLLQGGRGGEVRLKLYLCLSLLATAHPYDIGKPIRSSWWAEALGLPDPETAGARRISDALDWLDRHKLIRLVRRPGRPSTVVLLDPRGGGGAYRTTSEAKERRYVQVPLGLWRQEWIVVLSGSALALLLVLLELQGGETDANNPPFLATGRHEQYGLSEDTWTRASKQLQEHKLLSAGSVLEGRDLDMRRRRNTYWVDQGRLDETPDSATTSS